MNLALLLQKSDIEIFKSGRTAMKEEKEAEQRQQVEAALAEQRRQIEQMKEQN